ncbi:hypothetical protein F0L74_02375 [Chitinophaga agrisoli]|uniref:Prokaryotic RING finger family 4 n=1 Tax=Chitinophaga agrisoli TaxID=2607653 RepID=A0A5B2W2C0_9BACT|nr:hypothetical protein [Chitinophaga agrisoli]KAA2244832.1 hypothetical protein F0L74_02375 [Chitinophaga agrisoli]
MRNQLLTVSLRQQAIFIPDTALLQEGARLTGTTGMLLINLSKLGFTVSEPLLQALKSTIPGYQSVILDTLQQVLGMHKNWTPLVKDWEVPTYESLEDHIATYYANIFQDQGACLPCGHIIPDNTFPLYRYNGCPFCGMPFVNAPIEHIKQGSQQKVLELWTRQDASAFLHDLLTSKTALDATQTDSLRLLLNVLPLPEVKVGMKETLMEVIDTCINAGQPEKVQPLLASPTDVLRYLWFKHTGFLQIIAPKTIVKRIKKNNSHIHRPLDNSAKARINAKNDLKLKYGRKECLMVADWLNNMAPDVAAMCENMHAKRGMWVRFIRALRLPEYSKRKGFEKLHALLDMFYHQRYDVWDAHVQHYRLRFDADSTFNLLQDRPGLFARSLFANMLWFGNQCTVEAFSRIVDKVPARLLVTLSMYAENCFEPDNNRVVKPLGGVNKNIPANRLLKLYSNEQLQEMKDAVADLCLLAVKKRFEAIENTAKTIYIDPKLFKMPMAIGDRSNTVQDLPAALMGTRFTVEGNTVRLFMQWGTGMMAQHLDMDLSCMVTYDNRQERCSYSSLVISGCKHSGDIRHIPNRVGTAEYIEIDVYHLQQAGARYVTFTCNAYSNGSISPNLVVGWMNSKYPMKISAHSGVAYDPSCVQYQVRITNSLDKGLVFGVLDVQQAEIVWLEMPFEGQIVQRLDMRNITAMLKKLDSKLSVGQLLRIKAEAQGLQELETADAEESYTVKWAQNAAAVTKLLLGD